MKQINDYIIEKFKINSKTVNKSDRLKKEIDELISDYLSNNFKYELDKEYTISLSDDHNWLLIDFDYDLHLSERKLNDIGDDISNILKKKWIPVMSRPMLSSSGHDRCNHQIGFYL